MKKQTQQKLRLKSETIRQLQHAELIRVVGGVNVSVGTKYLTCTCTDTEPQ
jgi:hypothetical protein